MYQFGNKEQFGSLKAHDPAKYYRPYCYVSEDSLASAIAEQAREELVYARNELRKYRRHVNRTTVEHTDKYEYMGGHSFINHGLWALQAVCESFKVREMARLAKVLQRHCERLDEAFRKLYERDRDQILAARDAHHKAEMDALLHR